MRYIKWLVIGRNRLSIHDGSTERQALARNKFGKGEHEYSVFSIEASDPFAPKGRRPKANESGYEFVNGTLSPINSNLTYHYSYDPSIGKFEDVSQATK